MTEVFIQVLATYSVTMLIATSLVFLISQIRSDNSIMDIFYGPLFAIATWVTLSITGVDSPLAYFVAILVSVWATRLGGRILRKNWGKPEDARYAAWRNEWLQRGRLYFTIRSYLQINLLQGLIIVIVSFPIISILAAEKTLLLSELMIDSTLVFGILIAGLSVWVAGLILETTADWQLDHFIARKKAGTEPANLMRTGLFRYSRRPNYFGESLIWWGLALIALPTPLGYFALLSPLLITFIMTRVTGPILEEIFLKKYPEEYKDYMDKTSYFIPLPSKS